MSARPYILAETTWKTVAATSYAVAVLRWGATEAHNHHLPYATDTMQCDAIAAEAARIAWETGARVVVLPTVPFGVQTGQLDIPLCLNMNPSTQAALLRDLTGALNAQGIRKLVILNGHGGNDFRAIIRELLPTSGMFLCVLDWYKALPARDFFDDPGDHAGELETSLMQHIAPRLVLPLDQAGEGRQNPFRIRALREGWAWTPRHWREATADTGVGNPRASTPQKGAAYFAALTAKIAGFFVELAAADLADLYCKEPPQHPNP